MMSNGLRGYAPATGYRELIWWRRAKSLCACRYINISLQSVEMEAVDALRNGMQESEAKKPGKHGAGSYWTRNQLTLWPEASDKVT